MSEGKYRFYSQGMDSKELQANQALRESFSDLSDAIDGITLAVNPRYRALAQTHLEIAGMFATKMLSHNEERG